MSHSPQSGRLEFLPKNSVIPSAPLLAVLFYFIYVLFYLLCFSEARSHCTAQTALKRNPPTPASQEVGLQARTTLPSKFLFFNVNF
jgi:hypothetical protein